MAFLESDFLLSTPEAVELYTQYAEPEPIFDYHCHLSPKDLAENRQFRNLFEIWLEGDHYKWRAMRTNGVAERFVTGDASPREKFLAWAATVPQTLRNPLYHWTHLELRRCLDIGGLLDESTAEDVWAEGNEKLARPEFSVWGMLQRFRVTTVCTTDDPADDLAHHQALARSECPAQVLPAFRPDAALNVHKPAAFQAWLKRLEAIAGRSVESLAALLETLRARLDFFHAQNCRLSDHGLEACFGEPGTEVEVAAIFDRARAGQAATAEELSRYGAYLMHFLGSEYAARGWTMQLHLGALRNNNTRLLSTLGPDTGFDSIGDFPQGSTLSAFLNRLDTANALPKTILYNLNPADNYLFAAMIGNFQDGTLPAKVQWGSGWWFLDQKEGMEWQMNALSSLGLISRFVGMVTDSRSFMSYPRHEYFRRVLCNLFGKDMARGEVPNDLGLVGPIVRNICYGNASNYLAFPSR